MTLHCVIDACDREAVTVYDGFALCAWCLGAWRAMPQEMPPITRLWLVGAAREHAASDDVPKDVAVLVLRRWRAGADPRAPRASERGG